MTWLALAKAYARIRWCWDDEPFLEEVLEPVDREQRPDTVIDQLAEHFDLDDPMAPWSGAVREEDVDALRHTITTFMAAQRSDLHALPHGDRRPHDVSRTCWCHPDIETRNPVTGRAFPFGRALVIHHSADGRELIETHGIQ